MTQTLDPGLGELLRHLLQLVDGGAETAYRQKGLDYRPRYTPIMRALADGPPPVGAITARLSISQGAVSQTVARMQEEGLVTRWRGEDGRRVVVALSSSGQQLLGALQGHWAATFQAVGELEAELGVPLRDVLARTAQALERSGFADRIAAAESASDRRAHFQGGGTAYARYRPDYPTTLAAALAALAPSRGLAVDVGCGSGQMARLLADHFEQVVASDVSGDQLAHAAVHPRVAYRRESAEAMSIPNGRADLIVAAQAAHWFDLPRFYREARRVGSPGAVLALVSYGVPRLEGEADALLQHFYRRELGPYWPPERRQVESGYADLPFPFAPLPLVQPPLLRHWNLGQMTGYLHTWSATRRALADGQAQRVERFEARLAALWGPPETQRSVRWLIAVRAGRLDTEIGAGSDNAEPAPNAPRPCGENP